MNRVQSFDFRILKPIQYTLDDTNFTGEHAQHSFMNVHDWIIGSFVVVDNWISVQADNQVVAHFFGLFQEIQMTHMEQVEGAADVNLRIRAFRIITFFDSLILPIKWIG